MSNLSHDFIIKLIFERLGKNEEDKLNELEQFSDIEKVRKKAEKLGIKNMIYPSTRKDKKYMVRHPDYHNFIHFGQMGASDYTKTGDINKRNNFMKRNKRWANAQPYTSAWASYYLLW